jgi:carbonic anhydrase/acetyltransferase-like protein (isoleucine patch superfamily)
MIYDLGEDRVQTSGDDYYIAPNSAVIGKAVLGRDVSIWFNVVLRADNDLIEIGERSNVQDGSVFHVDAGSPAILGAGVSVGHSATVHGCRVGDGTLIGMGATILSGAVIGKQCIVGAGAVITGGKEFPDRSLLIGAPARRIREVRDEEIAELERIVANYVERGKFYKAALKARPPASD